MKLSSNNPSLLYYMPTYRCNCRCEFCYVLDKVTEYKEKSLQINDIKQLLKDAKNAGLEVLTLLGGEPLLSPHCSEIYQYSRFLGFFNSICTNGSLLAQKADQVIPYLDMILLSIDATNDAHDVSRKKKGLFNSIIEGLEKTTQYKDCKVIIWTSLNKSNLHEVDNILKIAEQFNVTVEFYPTKDSPHSKAIQETLLSPQELSSTFTQIREFKKNGRPIETDFYSLDLLIHNKKFNCDFQKMSIFIEPDGSIMSCGGFSFKKWGKFKEQTFHEIYRNSQYQEFVQNMQKCNTCRFPCTLHFADNNKLRSLKTILYNKLQPL